MDKFIISGPCKIKGQVIVSGVSFPFRNINWATPSLAYTFAGKGVVFENSKVT